MLSVGSARADAPPFQYNAPPNGAQISIPPKFTGAKVAFACPKWDNEFGYDGSWSSYWVDFATSPELNPYGELATPYKVGLDSANPTNAAEDQCEAELGFIESEKAGTYYWQVRRLGCFLPECTQAKGPVWSFTLVAPLPAAPTGTDEASSGRQACLTAGRIKARIERRVDRILSALRVGQTAATSRKLRRQLRDANGDLRRAKQRVRAVC